MKHEIKLNQAYADAVLNGEKTFEVRYDDRGYKVGDNVQFTVVDDAKNKVDHPLNACEYEITYVLHGWGLKENWCAFSIKPTAQTAEE